MSEPGAIHPRMVVFLAIIAFKAGRISESEARRRIISAKQDPEYREPPLDWAEPWESRRAVRRWKRTHKRGDIGNTDPS